MKCWGDKDIAEWDRRTRAANACHTIGKALWWLVVMAAVLGAIALIGGAR